MKKLTAVFLLSALVFGLCGCSFFSGSPKEPVEFFYPWADLETAMKQYPACTAIGSEMREASGHTGELNYLLPLYLRGPLDPELKSPFPAGCQIVGIRWEQKTLHITLNGTFAQLDGLDLTTACSCLAKTCFGMTSAYQVCIEANSPDGNSTVSVVIKADSLLLEDDYEPSETETVSETK